jgi:hypothetical protein
MVKGCRFTGRAFRVAAALLVRLLDMPWPYTGLKLLIASPIASRPAGPRKSLVSTPSARRESMRRHIVKHHRDRLAREALRGSLQGRESVVTMEPLSVTGTARNFSARHCVTPARARPTTPLKPNRAEGRRMSLQSDDGDRGLMPATDSWMFVTTAAIEQELTDDRELEHRYRSEMEWTCYRRRGLLALEVPARRGAGAGQSG